MNKLRYTWELSQYQARILENHLLKKMIIIDMISLCLFYDALITAWLQKW